VASNDGAQLRQCATVARDLGIDVEITEFADGRELLGYLFGESSVTGEMTLQCPPVDAILLDSLVGSLSGMTILKAIKRSRSCHHLPTIIFSATEFLEEIRDSYESGCNSYVVTGEGGVEDDELKMALKYWIALNQSPSTIDRNHFPPTTLEHKKARVD
jgi:CheY-like chemotaxis protein